MNRPLIVLCAWVITEIAVFIVVGEQVGVLPVLIATAATAFVGVSLFRFQGPGLMRRMDAAMKRDEPPAEAVADGIGMAMAALLLILPGLITDTLGVLLAVPGLRLALLTRLWRLGPWQAVRRGGTVIEGEFVDLGTPPPPDQKRIDRPEEDR